MVQFDDYYDLFSLFHTGEDVQYENTELTKNELDGKSSRLDVLVFTANRERINVEIQLEN